MLLGGMINHAYGNNILCVNEFSNQAFAARVRLYQKSLDQLINLGGVKWVSNGFKRRDQISSDNDSVLGIPVQL